MTTLRDLTTPRLGLHFSQFGNTEPPGPLTLKHLQGSGTTGLGTTRNLSALHLQYMPLQPWTPDTPVWAFSCGGDQIQVQPSLRLPHFLLLQSPVALPQMMLGSDGNHAHLNTSFRAGEKAQWPNQNLDLLRES